MEEKINIQKLMTTGDYQNLTCLIVDMDPDKEIELQKICDSLKPQAEGFESKIKDEYWKSHPLGPQNPEEEAELQKSLEDEFAEYRKKVVEDDKKRLAALQSIPAEIKAENIDSGTEELPVATTEEIKQTDEDNLDNILRENNQ